MSLEETKFVHDILPGALKPAGGLVLGSEHKKGEGATGQHVLKDVADGMSGACANLVRLDCIAVLVVKMVLQVAPCGAFWVPYTSPR